MCEFVEEHWDDCLKSAKSVVSCVNFKSLNILKATCFCLVVLAIHFNVNSTVFSTSLPLPSETTQTVLSMALYFGAMKGFWWNHSNSVERLDQRDDSLLRRGNTIKWNNLLNVPRFPQHRPLLPLLLWVYDIKRWIKNWFVLIPAAGTTAFMILNSFFNRLCLYFFTSPPTRVSDVLG